MEWKQLFEDIAGTIKAYIGRSLDPLYERVIQLEQRPTLAYRGEWNATTMYRMNDLTSDASHLWLCSVGENKGERPGSGSTNWQRVV